MDSTTQQKSAARPARPRCRSPIGSSGRRRQRKCWEFPLPVYTTGSQPAHSHNRALGAGRGCVGWLESELVQFARNLPLAPGKVGSRRRKVA